MTRKLKSSRIFLVCMLILLTLVMLAGCKDEQKTSYVTENYPLEREGIDLHLDCTSVDNIDADKDILLLHGVTYSSHEFDVDYKDYSLVDRLAEEGYRVWTLDIAGFGQSEEVKDGFMPDSDYAAEDIAAAVDTITKETGEDKIDVLGWSWGTVTVGRFAAKYPEHVDKVVLYAPILTGLGEQEVKEPFHHNTWEHAADDFQRTDDGEFDYTVTEPEMIEMFCSNCWHYDGESSPNGGRRDLLVPESEELINLSAISAETLVICGTNDPYMNYDAVKKSLDSLPRGSELEIIEGGSHIVLYEKPYYHDFQNRIVEFLEK